MSNAQQFDILRVGIASPQDIRSWSKGEVKKPETINYRTFKPERDGLFCERIFGPTKDWECSCGKYKKVKYKGIICDRCGVEVTRSKVRRRRMGHIELAAPVAHIWYVKGVPSPMSLLLDMSPRLLEKVLYFASYIVTRADTGAIKRSLDDIRRAADMEIKEIEDAKRAAISSEEKKLQELQGESGGAKAPQEEIDAQKRRFKDTKEYEERSATERVQDLNDAFKRLSEIEKKQLLSDAEYRSLRRLMDACSRKLDRNLDNLFSAGLGAEAVQQLLEDIDLEKQARELRKAIDETSGSKRARSIKRLEVVEAFRKSKNRPEWMIMEVIPVMPPELRPMVQLDGGRFATSDLNDLYRRIINRNNRLRRIIEIHAPESIINHEKRLLQESVDALIDNSRRSRPVTGSNGRPLKSLSDMLKGKEGRFRKNLLGKRVDYSGRSVIVVGPSLRLEQCGLPKEMALELFKPFVMKRLVEQGHTTNIKTAKRMVDRLRSEVWDALDDVIKEHPVLLNRAPTLHRLGIQAFVPVLVDGKAIQLHPLVCPAFNADFDGDQMAVHVPLSVAAQTEARLLMLSSNNLFSPADGRPVMSPEYDIVLGCYYLTQESEQKVERVPVIASEDEAILAFDTGKLDLHATIKVRVEVEEGRRELLQTTVGRVMFNRLLPMGFPYVNEPVTKSGLRDIIRRVYEQFGHRETVEFLDKVKDNGFRFGTMSGISIALSDMAVPHRRDEIVAETERQVDQTNAAFRRGLISAGEREQKVCEHWIKASEEVAEAILADIGTFNPLFMMANSGARGSKKQISQLAGMRGLMTEPSGRFIEDLPIKSNFHEGLTVLEYFISTHGARKGLADTALRTADAGYLTRRLVDVAQDVIIREDDCGTLEGIEVTRIDDSGDIVENLWERINGRIVLENVVHPETGEVIVAAGEQIDVNKAHAIEDAGVESVRIRSVLTCESETGVCARCYGNDLSTGRLVEIGEAVGIIAAQSIGEPGTQLTMRTFHLGGVAGQYLTGVADVKKKKREALETYHRDRREGIVGEETRVQSVAEQKRRVQEMLRVLEDSVRGLLRVVELFEARRPKGKAVVTEVDGTVHDVNMSHGRQVVIHSPQRLVDNPDLVGSTIVEPVVAPKGRKVLVEANTQITREILGELIAAGVQQVIVAYDYLVPYRGHLEVKKDDSVSAGDRLTGGPLAPQEVIRMKGVAGVQDYLVSEIQIVYKSQGVDINDKHIEVIVRQMLRKRRIIQPGDTDLLPGQVVDRSTFARENALVREQNGEEATAEWVLLGITEAALATDSFLSAASFQKTTKVLTEAATRGKQDLLVGLKENVIIGRLIPAGTGMPEHNAIRVVGPDMEEEFDILAPEVEERPTDETAFEEIMALADSAEVLDVDDIEDEDSKDDDDSDDDSLDEEE